MELIIKSSVKVSVLLNEYLSNIVLILHKLGNDKLILVDL